MERVLVTGATGMVGRCLLAHLAHLPIQILAVGRHSKGELSVGEYYQGDLVRSDVLDRISAPVGMVIHLAAAAHHCVEPDDLLDNTYSVYRLAKKMDEWGTQRVIFTSSAAVYETPEPVTLVDENSPIRPSSFYGLTKVLAETTLKTFDVPTLILRCTYLYSEDDRASALFHLLNQIKHGISPEVRDEYRDYLHVDDAVRAIVTCLSYEGRETVFNIGSGRPIAMQELTRRAIEQWYGKSDAMNFQVAGRRRNTSLNCARAGQELGWQPLRSVLNDLPHLLAAF